MMYLNFKCKYHGWVRKVKNKGGRDVCPQCMDEDAGAIAVDPKEIAKHEDEKD